MRHALSVSVLSAARIAPPIVLLPTATRPLRLHAVRLQTVWSKKKPAPRTVRTRFASATSSECGAASLLVWRPGLAGLVRLLK